MLVVIFKYCLYFQLLLLGVKMVGDVGSPGNYYIPDHTLAQLTVKELNKRVSQVSQPSLLLTVVW